MAPDYKYLILLNWIYASILAFISDLLIVSIRSALNFWAKVGLH